MKKYWMSTGSGEIEIEFTVEQARRVSGMGDMYSDTSAMVRGEMREQLKAIDPELLRKTLKEYGAWDDDELKDHKENLIRIVWILANDLTDSLHDYNPVKRGECVECGYSKAVGYHN